MTVMFFRGTDRRFFVLLFFFFYLLLNGDFNDTDVFLLQ